MGNFAKARINPLLLVVAFVAARLSGFRRVKLVYTFLLKLWPLYPKAPAIFCTLRITI